MVRWNHRSSNSCLGFSLSSVLSTRISIVPTATLSSTLVQKFVCDVTCLSGYSHRHSDDDVTDLADYTLFHVWWPWTMIIKGERNTSRQWSQNVRAGGPHHAAMWEHTQSSAPCRCVPTSSLRFHAVGCWAKISPVRLFSISAENFRSLLLRVSIL